MLPEAEARAQTILIPWFSQLLANTELSMLSISVTSSRMSLLSVKILNFFVGGA